MIHKFKRHTRSYLVLSKDCLLDKTVSWRAKGLHSYLISLPEDWVISMVDLINRSSDGRLSTENAVNELLANGYMTRIQSRNEMGRVGKVFYEAFEVPFSQMLASNELSAEECRFTASGFTANGKSTTTKDTLETKDKEEDKKEAFIDEDPDLDPKSSPSEASPPNPNPMLASQPSEEIGASPTAPECRTSHSTNGYSKFVFVLWKQKCGGKPRSDLREIKDLCLEYGVPTVEKAFKCYLNDTDAKYASLQSFCSKFGVWLKQSGGPVLTAAEKAAKDAEYYRKPSFSME